MYMDIHVYAGVLSGGGGGGVLSGGGDIIRL